MRGFVKGLILTGVAATLLMVAGCTSPARVVLFNGRDLSGWVSFAPGVDRDVQTTWSVRDGVIYCSGVPNGYLRTEDDYRDYQLHLEWRWVAGASNSGVFVHLTGEDKLWPELIECQLWSGNAGDLVLFPGTSITYNGEARSTETTFLDLTKRAPSSENPIGEWNSYDIVCRGDTIRTTVNGVFQSEGTQASETWGKIGLQSEGGPIEFRNIYIEPLG